MRRQAQPKPFQVSVRKAGSRVLMGPLQPADGAIAKEAEEIGLIQGKTPDSLDEWHMAIALSQEGLGYTYQVPVFGGRTVRGGTIIDFLVSLNPWPQPIFVDPSYWHSNQVSAEDQLKRARLDATNWYLPHLSIMANDLVSIDSIRQWIRKNLK